MKWINVILSIYLIALSCLPCADTEVDSPAHVLIKVASNHDEHSQDKENDLCSPFCNCACCGSQIVSYFQATAISIPILFESIKTQSPTYKSILSSNFYGSIWQPPQIV